MMSPLISTLLSIVGGCSLLCCLISFAVWIIFFIALPFQLKKTNLTADEKKNRCQTVLNTQTGEIKSGALQAGITLFILLIIAALLWLSVDVQQMSAYMEVVRRFSIWTAVLYVALTVSRAAGSILVPQMLREYGPASILVLFKKNLAAAGRTMLILLILCAAIYWIMSL